MKINKRYIAVGMIIAFTLLFELAAHADESNQATTITFSKPIQIPGQILPAGTYSFKLLDSNSDPNVVQIFNSDQTHLYAMLQTVATERQDSTGDTAITLAEPGAEKPDVLLKWFYPGNLTGHEFVYSDQQEKQLAQDAQQTIVANQSTNANSEMGAGN
jgi:Protein of unknown function (DUF2911)